MERDYFPRGGAKDTPVIQYKQFVFEKNKRLKGNKKRTKPDEKTNLSSERSFSEKGFHSHLKYSDLCVGFQSICAVHSILKDRLLVNLPYEMRAYIHYPSAGTIRSKGSEREQHMNLSRMFYVGQMLSCKVVDRVVDDEGRKSQVNTYVTADPAAVNRNLNAGMVNEHSMIQMAVSSVEDRGYMMDSGIVGVMAFLPFDQAIKYSKTVFGWKKPLCIGTILWCYVVKSTVNSSSAKFVEVSVCHSATFELECIDSPKILWPGSRVNTTITKVYNDDCCQVQVDGTDIYGTVNAQLDFSKNPSSTYFIGSGLKATVMTCNPFTDEYNFSFSHHVYKPIAAVNRAFKETCVATVDHVSKFVIYLTLEGKNFKGILVVKNLISETEEAPKVGSNKESGDQGGVGLKPEDHVKVEIVNVNLLSRKYICKMISQIDSDEFWKSVKEMENGIDLEEPECLSDDGSFTIKQEPDSDFDVVEIKEEILSDTQDDSGIETGRQEKKSKRKRNKKKKETIPNDNELLDVEIKEEIESDSELKQNKESDLESDSKSKKKRKKATREHSPDHVSLNGIKEGEHSLKRKNNALGSENGSFKKLKKSDKDAGQTKTPNEANAVASLSLKDIKAEYLWDATPDDLAKVTSKHLEEFEDESDEQDDSNKKPLSKKQKKANEIEKERLIREKEEELLKALDDPKSADHYERLILSRPDDSKVWIKYMSFHLESTEIEKAKAVGNRALKLINHRNEQDRLNIWLALLNLEHLYGTKELFKETWTEALKCNDDYKVNSKVLEIYVGAQNSAEITSLVQRMIKQYKDNSDCWYACLSALMSTSMEEKARDLLQRALKSLPPKTHVTLISRFALLENSCGHSEEAQALFDNLLTSYPARIDLWFVYVDMLTKSNQTELARQVFERAVSLKLPAKKMKSLYKKWLEFEEKHGSEESVETVRKSAVDYVERATKEIGT